MTSEKRASVPSPIAIDGPAASGKSSVGAALAARYGFLLFDTGVTYRAFALTAIERGVAASDGDGCISLATTISMRIRGNGETHVSVDGVDVTDRLREPEVEHNVSHYSAIAGVRDVMVRLQRKVAVTNRAVVLGRDIGTVVLPEAPVKLFLTASDKERALRRARQAALWGQHQDAAGAGADIAARDRIDSTRTTAPLRPAADAILIDTTGLTLQEVIQLAIEAVECRPD